MKPYQFIAFLVGSIIAHVFIHLQICNKEDLILSLALWCSVALFKPEDR